MVDLVLIANADDGTISTLVLHQQAQARLEVLATSGDLPGCGTFAVDPDRLMVFAAYKGDEPGIATLRLDPDTGELTELSRRPVGGSMTYLSLTEDRTALLGVSYSGGFGALWPIDGERLGEPRSRFEYANLHCIVQHDRFVYAVSLGDDLIAQFTLEESGLVPLDPPTVALPAGSGPRHLTLDGQHAYLMTEFTGEAIRLERQEVGQLVPAESRTVIDLTAGLSVSRFGADPLAEQLIWGADIHLAAGGRFLLTSERTSSRITSTSLTAEGHVGEVIAHTSTLTQPRGFGVSPDGALVVAVGEKADQAQLLAVQDDGRLLEVDRVRIGRGANWVQFVSQ